MAPALVGRDAELALLRQKMAAAAAGRGSILLVGGDHGSGKSRIGAEVERLADKSGTLFLHGRGDAAHADSVYGALGDILTSLLREAPAAERQALRSAVKNLVPHLAKFLFPGEDIADLPEGEADQELRQTLFLLRVKSLLCGLAQRQRLVLFIDDLHLADWPSIQLLRHLALSIQTVPIVVVATFRPSGDADHETDGNWHRLNGLILNLCTESHVEYLRLAPLSLDETRTFAESRFARSNFEQALIDLLYEKTLGRPLFLIEWLDFLRERGIIYRQRGLWKNRRVDDVPVPDSITEIALDRVYRLPVEDQTLLAWASVQGQHFEGLLLAETSMRPPVETLRALGRIERTTHLIEGTGSGFRFTHGLLQETLYELLPTVDKKRMHRRAADALQRHSPRELESLAFHLYRSDNQIRALPYLIVSGRRALSACAYYDARRFLEAALELCEMGTPRGAQSRKVETLLLMAEVSELLGEWATSAQRCKEVLRISDRDRHGLAVGKALTRLASLRLRRGAPLEALQLNREALEVLGPVGEQSVTAEAYLQMGLCAVALSRFPAARRHFAEARRRAGSSGDERLLGLIRQQLGDLSTVSGQYLEATLSHMQALGSHRRSADRYAMSQGYAKLGANQEAQERWSEALRCYVESADVARQIGAIELLAESQASQARTHVRLGQYAPAEMTCVAARNTMEALEHTRGLTQCDIVDAAICRHRGDYSGAEELLLQARHSLGEQGDRLAEAECDRELGILQYHQGDPDGARQRLAASTAQFRELGALDRATKTENILSDLFSRGT